MRRLLAVAALLLAALPVYQIGDDLPACAFFTASGTGATGLTVTVDGDGPETFGTPSWVEAQAP